MSSRRNFLDADNSIMEKNLRFVKNDLEENLNQYFGGSTGRGNNSNAVTAPPRDYKVVQPKPGGSHAQGLEKRRGFLLELGLARHEAYELAKNSDFDVKSYEEKCQRWLRNGFRKDELVKEILFDIHNENNRNKNHGHEDAFPTKPHPTEQYERQDNFKRQYNEMDQHERNYSRSNFISESSYRPSRSGSPKRNMNTFDDRNRREYFAQNSDFRNEIDKSAYRRRSPSPRRSPPRNYPREEMMYSSRSRSPNRILNTEYSSARRNEEYLSQPPEIVFSSRSRSPNRIFNAEYSARRNEEIRPQPPEIISSSRSRSPHRIFNTEYSARRNEEYLSQSQKIVSSSRSRSPHRIFNAEYSARRNEEYLSQTENLREHRHRSRSFSPPRTYTSRSRSPHRDFRERQDDGNFLRYNKYGDEEKRMTFSGQPHNRPFSPNRNESQQQIKPHSPSKKNEGFMLDYDYSRDDLRTSSRAYSPPRHERVLDHRKLSRSRSPMGQYFAHDERAYSPPKPSRREEEFYQSTRSQSFSKSIESRNESGHVDFSAGNFNISINPSPTSSRFHSHEMNNQNPFTNNPQAFKKDMSRPPIANTCNKKIPSLLEINVNPNQIHNENPKQLSHKSNIPSLLEINLAPHQGQNTKQLPPQKSNIPSLLSLKVFPDKNVQQPSTSSSSQVKPRDFKSNVKQIQTSQGNKNIKNSESKGKNKRFPQANPQLKPYRANIDAIPTGRQKPQPGHLKANPQYYWSQWWPQYKYIEYSLPEIDPSDIQIQKCIKFKYDSDFLTQQRKRVLLKNGVKKIMRTSEVNEKNYYSRDIFKIFKYKKHLEDPTFQNSLTPRELNLIAPALRQFQIKPILAYLHQALIVKWHVSVDIIKKVQAGAPIMSAHARSLLNDKAFHYLVNESIQELKQMCQQDWPQFRQFYEKLETKKIDIYAFGVGPSKELNLNHNDNSLDGNEDDDNDDDDDDNY